MLRKAENERLPSVFGVLSRISGQFAGLQRMKCDASRCINDKIGVKAAVFRVNSESNGIRSTFSMLRLRSASLSLGIQKASIPCMMNEICKYTNAPIENLQ